jgi:DNA-binding transcriptional LysR family regulator
MDIEALRAFQTIASCGSFSKAATKIYITQPALSKKVKKIEQELNSRLFIRKPKGVELTEKGEKLLKITHLILSEITYLKEDIQKDDAGLVGNITFGCPTVVIHYFLPSFLPSFNKKYPDIFLQIKEAESPEIISGILDEHINCGIVVGPIKNQEMEYHCLTSCPLVCIALKGKIISSNKFLTLAQICGYPFIAYDEVIKHQALINAAFNKSKVFPKTIIRAKSTNTILEIVKMGMGVAIVPEYILNKHINRDLFAKYRVKDLDLQAEFGLIIKKANLKNKLFESFYNFVLESYSSHLIPPRRTTRNSPCKSHGKPD